MTELPLSLPFRMDTRILLASLALSFLCALVCGLAPAVQGTRADLVNAALRRSLPRDGQAATVLVAAFARNLELARGL